MNPRELQRIVRDMAGKSDQAVDRELAEHRLSAEDKIAAKIELAAMAQRRTLTASLATDTAQWHSEQPMQPMTEIERLMQRAGLLPGGKYTEADIEEGCRLAGIVNPTQKLAVKLEAEQRGMLTRAKPSQGMPPLYAMHAAAERPAGSLLKTRDGNPVVLKSIPE
jgi:hypothetical protein